MPTKSRPSVTKFCTVLGCGKKHVARNLCNRHYLQWSHGQLKVDAPLTYDRHGMYRSKTYNSWRAMKSRCTRKKDVRYSQYGGRGIEVCGRWLNSFTAFLADMGERPEGTTLDRIDNDGNYEPGNCRWATPTSQTHNTRLRSDNQSGHKGVFYRKDKKKWSAYINVDKTTKRKYLGMYENYEGALSARLVAEGKLN